MSRPVVAAICYRDKHRQGPVEFLLVRTKGAKHWTFPKGHVEEQNSELPWMAAKREAEEEAGVRGTIETEPLTSYAYQKGKNGREDIVTAYLMSVEAQHKPAEPERKPQWFTPAGALAKLAERREERYVREHEKVIKAALSKLNRAK